MTSEQFAYWLQGFVELNGSAPTPEQWQGIKDHLQTVFVKVTPQISITQPGTMHPALTKDQEEFMRRANRLYDVGPKPATC